MSSLHVLNLKDNKAKLVLMFRFLHLKHLYLSPVVVGFDKVAICDIFHSIIMYYYYWTKYDLIT